MGTNPPIFHPGGGGGGTLVILSDGKVRIPGTLEALGGTGIPGFFGGKGGNGAGGSILVRALRGLSVSGRIDARAPGPNPSSGEGYIRLDCYAKPPQILLGSFIQPRPEVLELPELRLVGTPRVGGRLEVSMASIPGDLLGIGWSLGKVYFPYPPFGVLRLDPGAGFLLAGTALVPGTGIDPLAGAGWKIPDAPVLVGLTLYMQALNLITATNFPRFTNLETAKIQKK